MSKEDVLQAVVEHLASQCLEAEADALTYREMLQVTLAQNAELLKLNASLRQQVIERRNEIRRYVELQMVNA